MLLCSEPIDFLFDCNSEERLCLGNRQQIDQYLSNQVSVWHSACDPHLIYTPPTPVQSSVTALYSTEACLSASVGCQQLTNARVSCTQDYQQGRRSISHLLPMSTGSAHLCVWLFHSRKRVLHPSASPSLPDGRVWPLLKPGTGSDDSRFSSDLPDL